MVLLKSEAQTQTLTRNIMEAVNNPSNQDIKLVFSDNNTYYSAAVLVTLRYGNTGKVHSLHRLKLYFILFIYFIVLVPF